MKNKISKECSKFLTELKKYIGTGMNSYIYNCCLIAWSNPLFYDDGMIHSTYQHRDGFLGYISKISIEKTRIEKGLFFDSHYPEYYLPFTEVEMKYIFNETEKYLKIIKKKNEEDRKSLLMKLNLTEGELRQLKQILS